MTTSRDTIPSGDVCDCCLARTSRLTARLRGTWVADRAGFVPRLWV